jgi:CheY-like chemotaxis protein
MPELHETHIVLMGGQPNGSSDSYPILAKPFTQEKLLKTIQTIQGIPAPAEGLLDKRVMIVDDSPIVRDVLRLALQKEGLEVQEAINALMALEILDNPPFPHLVVIDLMLPEMDGFELIDRLKNMPHTQNIPIIVITAKQLTEEEQTRLSHSALYVLQKGFFSHIELAHRINDIVQKQLPNQTHSL